MDYGLSEGDVIRFRRIEGGNWTVTTLAGINKDGSLHLYNRRGSARDIMPERCEVKRKGPRGGTLWIPVDEEGEP